MIDVRDDGDISKAIYWEHGNASRGRAL
jgi:hypothetical protein